MPETSPPTPAAPAKTRAVWLGYGGRWWAAVSGSGLADVSAPGAVWQSWVTPNASAEPGWSSTQTGGFDG